MIINAKDKKSKQKKQSKFSPFKALMALRMLWIDKGLHKILANAGIKKRTQGLSPKELALATMIQPLVGSKSEKETAQRTDNEDRFPEATQKQINRFLNRSQNRFENLLATTTGCLLATKPSDVMILDDTPIEKSGKKMQWAGKFFNAAEQYYYHGYELVVLALARGRAAFPLNFIPKRSPKKKRKANKSKGSQNKLRLALKLIEAVLKQGLKARYIVFDSWYGAVWFLQKIEQLGLYWVTPAKRNRLFIYQGRKIKASSFVKMTLGADYYPWKFIAELPKYSLVGVVVNYRCPQYEVLVTNDLSLSAEKVVRIYKKRWKIETLFREAKQHYGLEAFHNQNWCAIIAHFALSLLAQFLVRFFLVFHEKSLKAINVLKKIFVRMRKKVKFVFPKWEIAFDEIFNYFKISKDLKICLISV